MRKMKPTATDDPADHPHPHEREKKNTSSFCTLIQKGTKASKGQYPA